MKIEGNIVDVQNEKVFPGEIEIRGEKIFRVLKNNKKYKNFLLPGLIDAHLHLESSLLSIPAFSKEAIKHGTTSVITDCHEIANVYGLKGVDFMMKASKLTPLKVYFSVPSCIPATPFEDTGIKIGPREIRSLMKRKKVVALGEMMNFLGVINEDKEVIEKIKIAKKFKKPIDGHAPLLSGKNLKKYISFGISTDHECTSFKEAKEKMRLGMKIMIREGSAAKNLKNLIGLNYDNCFLVSDDIEAKELVEEGHLDRILRKAIKLGVPLMKAIKMVTLNPALHYNLDSGVITPRKRADLIEIENLKDFKIKKVFIDGKLIFEKGKILFPLRQIKIGRNIKIKKKKAEDFIIPAQKTKVTVRVIKLIPNQILTKEKIVELKTKNGEVVADPKKDILKIVVLNRYGKEKIGKGFVSGFGLKKGAIASSISHDSHHLIAVGVDDESITKAVNLVIKNGGLALVNKKILNLKLPLGGLMSLKEANEVARELRNLIKEAKKLGSKLKNPFITLSFLALLVIPELKISDKGLFNVKKFKFEKLLI